MEDLIELLMANDGHLSIKQQPYSLDVTLLREARMDLRKKSLLSRQQTGNAPPANLSIEIPAYSPHNGSDKQITDDSNVNFESNRNKNQQQNND